MSITHSQKGTTLSRTELSRSNSNSDAHAVASIVLLHLLLVLLPCRGRSALSTGRRPSPLTVPAARPLQRTSTACMFWSDQVRTSATGPGGRGCWGWMSGSHMRHACVSCSSPIRRLGAAGMAQVYAGAAGTTEVVWLPHVLLAHLPACLTGDPPTCCRRHMLPAACRAPHAACRHGCAVRAGV